MYNQAQELERLKIIKRQARYQYQTCKAIYENKICTAKYEDRKIFSNAINVLDGMYRMYEQLKLRMRRRSYKDQIVFAKKWEEYVSCIDTLTAHKTRDKYLLRYISIKDKFYAREKAEELWRNYANLTSKRFRKI